MLVNGAAPTCDARDLSRLAHRAAPSTSLRDLPMPLLQRVLVQSGTGAAPAALSCKELFDALVGPGGALSQPSLAALFLLSRYGPSTALFHVYDEGIQKGLHRGKCSHEAATAG